MTTGVYLRYLEHPSYQDDPGHYYRTHTNRKWHIVGVDEFKCGTKIWRFAPQELKEKDLDIALLGVWNTVFEYNREIIKGCATLTKHKNQLLLTILQVPCYCD